MTSSPLRSSSPSSATLSDRVASSAPRVLIVDLSVDELEVLQTALEHRGIPTIATTAAQRGLDMAKNVRPELILVDIESQETPEICVDFQEAADVNQAHLVILGNINGTVLRPQTEVVTKPYRYAPLLRKIESLLERPHAA